MIYKALVCFFFLPALAACSSSSSDGDAPDASTPDATSDATTSLDSGPHIDASGGDSASADAAPLDSSTADSSPDDAGCVGAWLQAPTVDPSITVPADGGAVLLHVVGAGTQNYMCTATDGGTAWTFVGPAAELSDCNGNVVGHHFASDAGAGFPEWQSTDGTFVVGQKLAAFTPDGGPPSVPWLLLHAVDHGGTGTLADVAFAQRLDADGGLAPSGECDAGASIQVPYGADYYFFGQ